MHSSPMNNSVLIRWLSQSQTLAMEHRVHKNDMLNEDIACEIQSKLPFGKHCSLEVSSDGIYLKTCLTDL